MLEITLPALEHWDERKEEFVTYKKALTLQFEHSLISLSKWESKYCKPFLGNDDKTDEELLDYIRFMTLTQNVQEDTYQRLLTTPGVMKTIDEYINSPMTATTFVEDKGSKKNGERITSELIYYWMIAHNIPDRFDKWHLNRLLTLVRVCNVKSQPERKMKPQDVNARNAALNAARKKQLNTKG